MANESLIPATEKREPKMTTLTLEQETNPWEAQAARFDYAATKLNLDQGIWKVLRYPSREIIVHIPVGMDDGSVEVFTGYRGAALHCPGDRPRAASAMRRMCRWTRSARWPVG